MMEVGKIKPSWKTSTQQAMGNYISMDDELQPVSLSRCCKQPGQ